MRALMISGDQFEDVELLAPRYRLLEAGIRVDVAAPTTATITGKKGYEVEVDCAVADTDPDPYQVLVLPGGKAPASLRDDPAILERVRHFMDADKVVAAICHGPQLLVSADRVRGRRLTAHQAVLEEIRTAGGEAVDEEVVIDGGLVTSRVPKDIPAWLREMMTLIER
ncbi:MAG: type 1 glutamine amidotransferase domain-containing protein [Pseudomonadota bacterium]